MNRIEAQQTVDRTARIIASVHGVLNAAEATRYQEAQNVLTQATPTYQLNARADRADVVAWPDERGPKCYMSRGQAEAALAKLTDAERFEVWRPGAGRSFYLLKR